MRTLNVLVCGLAIGSMGMSALAQNATKPGDGQPAQPGQPANGERPQRPGRGGGGGDWMRQTLSPEKAKAAWELEATGVATRLGAGTDKVKQIVQAYTSARESLTAAQDKMREDMRKKAQESAPQDGEKNAPPGRDGGGRRGGFDPEAMKAMEELTTKEKEKLKKSLLNALNPVQTDKAMASLGTFNRSWDAAVDAVAGFGLEAGKQQEALAAIEDWVVAQGKLRPQGRGPGGGGNGGGPEGAAPDREAMMKAMQESRQKLMDSMKKVLSEDQMKKFEESLPGRQMRGQRGGDRREAPADAGGGDQRF